MNNTPTYVPPYTCWYTALAIWMALHADRNSSVKHLRQLTIINYLWNVLMQRIVRWDGIKENSNESFTLGGRQTTRFCCSTGFSVESTMALNVYGKPLIEAKAMLTGESIFVTREKVYLYEHWVLLSSLQIPTHCTEYIYHQSINVPPNSRGLHSHDTHAQCR